MDLDDVKIDLEITEAEVRVTNLLLKQLVSALVAKGALDTMEIAGALLRTEVQAGLADDAKKDENHITDDHAKTAREAMQEWDAYFVLHPSLYALRRQEQQWRAGGSKGTHPFDEKRIAALLED